MRREAVALAAFTVVATPVAGQVEPSGTIDIIVAGEKVRALVRGMDQRVPGQPVFVLQAGAGSTLEAWGDLPDSLSVIAPVVAYDRPGLGGSDFNGVSPTPTRVAQHLREVLSELGVTPPYIMVGHSWGGPLILYFAGEFPDDVVGMLYLDPSHPERTWETFFLTTDPDLYAAREAEMNAFRTERPDWSDGRKAENRVLNSFWSSSVASRDLPATPIVPTTIILGTRYEQTGVSFMDRSFMEAFNLSRVRRFREWVNGHPQASVQVHPNAGHFVHLYEPGLVTGAARALLSSVLGRSRPAAPMLGPTL